jgi:energy-coupling factor transport system ATP-binding protein
MIEVRGLSHRPIWSGSRPKLFERLDLTLAPGEIVWLSGRNGAGKTTLARYLAGLLIPAEGSVTVDGFDTRNLTDLREVRRRVGLLFQESHAHLVAQTLLEEVAFGLENLAFPPEEIERRSRAALERVGLGRYSAQTVDALIPAERQRLAIAGLLALKPRYFIFDEPDTAADDEILREMILLLKELRAAGHGILLISHREFEERFYDRALRLEHGQLNVIASPVGTKNFSPLLPETLRTHERSFALEAQNLSFAYEGSSEFVLRDLSLAVRAGEFIVLQGAAGSGKSSLVQLLAGLEEPSRGEVLLNKREILALRAAERVRFVGLVFQEPSQQLLGESVAAELELGLEAQNLSQEEREARVRWACESVRLDWEQLRARPAQTLSGGEGARLAIAAILVLDPQMLILDETIYALDPEGQRQILTMLQKLHSQGKTVLLVVSSGFEEWAERLWVLKDGKLIEQDNKKSRGERPFAPTLG